MYLKNIFYFAVPLPANTAVLKIMADSFVLRQYRTNELVRWRMHFLSDAIAEIEGLLEVNRDFCKKQMAEKASPALPTNCAVVPLQLLYEKAPSRSIYGKGHIFEKSVLTLTCSLCLLLAFHAGLLVMLTLANLSQNAGTSALPLKPLQRALQGFVLTNTYLGHCYPSPRSSRLDISRLDGRMANRIVIISPLCLSVNR